MKSNRSVAVQLYLEKKQNYVIDQIAGMIHVRNRGKMV